MNILGLIPARSGSKGICRKNLTPFCGRPLISWTIDAAKEAPSLTHLACTTDDPEISKLAWDAGIKVIDRPAELASDQSPVIHAVEHALAQLSDTEFDAVFLLQPTNPLRIAADIEAAVEIFHRTQADSVISYIPCGDRHPYRMREIHSNRVIKPNFAEPRDGMPRQQMPEYYLRTGETYVASVAHIRKTRSMYGGRECPYMIPKERAWNVDEPLDLVIAGAMKEATACKA